jgi:outer membrane protein OmpA-like peptidoglycan-associated protein
MTIMRILLIISTTFFLIINGLSAQNGLVGEYYDGKNFNRLVGTRTDPKLHFEWYEAPMRGMNPESFSVRWKGRLQAPKSGTYTFFATVDDGIRVNISGQRIINAWGMNDHASLQGQITLTAGQMYDLEVEYFNGMLEGELKLFWQLPGDEPLFGGLAGYNERPIDAKYYFQPATTPKPAAPPKPAPAEKPKVAVKPEPKKTPKTVPPPAAQPAVVEKPAVAEKPATPPPPAKPHPDSLKRFVPKNVLFEQSKAVILETSKPELDRLAAYLMRHPEQKVRIEGHTDNIGDPASNLSLSKKRAQSVARYLTAKGVATSRITTEGYGDTRPIVKSKSGESTASNRRVVFIIE